LKNLFLIATILFAQNAFSATMTLRFTGIQKIQGTLRWAAFVPGSKWATEGHSSFSGKVAVTGSEMIVKMDAVPYGSYGITAYQDVNNDGGHNRFPMEPFGFSNGARASVFGAPKFEKARIEFTSESQVFDIVLRAGL
jgi:uncharacterized protein (DUF2141 family)